MNRGEVMYTKTTTVINETGLHARPASDFVKAAKSFSSRIMISNADAGAGPVNAKSIVMVLSLALTKGTNIEICADGEDELEAAESLAALVDSGFGEA